VSKPSDSLNRYPGDFFLTPSVQRTAAWLAANMWLQPDEAVQSLERAGEGNMNCVVRVKTSRGSFILKQSRPWVEKYPGFVAPWDRALVEARFYRTAADLPRLNKYLPKLLNFSAAERLLMLEDLENARDFTFIYATSSAGLADSERSELVDFLLALHTSTRAPGLRSAFVNPEMRSLNHEHVFDLPLRTGNGLDLDAITPGLARLANDLQIDTPYCAEVAFLGERYLDQAAGECLIHGDYFPGSWLQARGRVYVIDPEFCFFGPPEWDLAIMTAHLHMSGHSQVQINNTLDIYSASTPIDRLLVQKFAGVEIMRRLIGVAQLPVAFGLERKKQLLQLSKMLVAGEQCP
jgi:5-methylthioribose kinase